MYADHLREPWIRHTVADLPGREIFDDHTHVGTHDPSGFSATMTELREGLALVDGRGAVFPMAEPEGYRDANLACAAAAADSDGTLVSFARITPHEEPDKLLHEALEAGARGVKLHLSRRVRARRSPARGRPGGGRRAPAPRPRARGPRSRRGR